MQVGIQRRKLAVNTIKEADIFLCPPFLFVAYNMKKCLGRSSEQLSNFIRRSG